MPINRAEKWPGPRCVTRLSPSPGREPGTEQGEGIPFAISLQWKMLKKRGHGSRRMQCFTMEKWNASLEPHPQTHYIKGHTFWGGQRGCGYVYRRRRDEGQWDQHPVVVPHPQWGLYQATCLLGRCCQSICTASPTASPIRLDNLSIVP